MLKLLLLVAVMAIVASSEVMVAVIDMVMFCANKQRV